MCPMCLQDLSTKPCMHTQKHLRRMLTKGLGTTWLPTARSQESWKQMEADPPSRGLSNFMVATSEFESHRVDKFGLQKVTPLPSGKCMPNPDPAI